MTTFSAGLPGVFLHTPPPPTPILSSRAAGDSPRTQTSSRHPPPNSSMGLQCVQGKSNSLVGSTRPDVLWTTLTSPTASPSHSMQTLTLCDGYYLSSPCYRCRSRGSERLGYLSGAAQLTGFISGSVQVLTDHILLSFLSSKCQYCHSLENLVSGEMRSLAAE